MLFFLKEINAFAKSHKVAKRMNIPPVIRRIYRIDFFTLICNIENSGIKKLA